MKSTSKKTKKMAFLKRSYEYNWLFKEIRKHKKAKQQKLYFRVAG